MEKVKSFTPPRLASAGLIKAIGDYTGGVLEKGTALVKEGLSGKVDARTYNRRVDEYFDDTVQMGVKSFLKDAADNIKLKVSNPLAGLKEKLGDTLLGKAAASVKEKIWATTAEDARTGIATPDEQYGAIDPRIALDVQEEETEWYQAETGIMAETPLPQEEVVAHVDENLAESPDSGWYAHGEGDGQNDHVQRDCETDWAGCPDDSSNPELQANAQKRDPWTDIDGSADEWEDSAAPDCRNAWVDIDADCGDEYQGDGGRSDETDVAGISDDAQGGTYQEAVDRLLGEEAAASSDGYSASDEGYEEALAHLEAEAAERERQARLAAEAAEREYQAQLEAESAEREREARLAAEAAERERLADSSSDDYDAGGQMLGAIFGGVIRGLENSGKIEAGTSNALAGISGLSQGSRGGFASGLNQSLNAFNALSSGMPNYGTGGPSGPSGGSNNCNGMNAEIERVTARIDRQGGGYCTTAREVKRVFTRAASYYQNNNCPAELVQSSRDMIAWANQTERASCN